MECVFSYRIKKLQQSLYTYLKCDAFFVPRVDRYQGEYVVESDERLSWLTGFTGSAGFAIVTLDKVALFVDGRYVLQAKSQIPKNSVDVFYLKEISPFSYLHSQFPTIATIAYDPWLHTIKEKQEWGKQAGKKGWQFIRTHKNPIDDIWEDQPPRPLSPLFPLDIQLTGQTAEEKIETVQKILHQKEVDWIYIGLPDDLCWLLNIRGWDFPHTPLIDALGFLSKEGNVTFVIHPSKVPEGFLRDHLKMIPESALHDFLKDQKNKKILVDPHTTPLFIRERLDTDQIVEGQNPIALLKASKNKIEQSGMRLAHLKDGVAIVKCLHWLSQMTDSITEMDVVQRLEDFRKEGKNYCGPSFPTIAAYGGHGAIVHYKPCLKTNKKLEKEGVFLLDSGGQYLEGTTDITRTIALGQSIDEEQSNFFTKVLKGHIALATIQFPQGTTGSQLDVLARQFLWQEGDDYDHGTGHGVGSFLNVHEGPQRISKSPSSIPLTPGMVLSNEPGYYKENEFGIRIENLVLVCESSFLKKHPFYCFETLTLAPIDHRLIAVENLTPLEREWINTYHEQVKDTLLPHIDVESVRQWLLYATKPI